METVTKALKYGGWYDVIASLVECGAIPTATHRILLYGPPGTGKTTCPFRLMNSKVVESITLHQQFPPDDMLGSMQLVEKNGATTTEWADGPAIRAMRRGGALVINEISRRSPEVESALYNVLDDLEICSVTLPNGETVTPSPGYCVFATMNDDPNCLPEAIQERFDLVLLCRRDWTESWPAIMTD
jgi:nitric oxide reductase NorQ protein